MKHEQGTSPILKEDQNGSLNYSGYSSASIVGNSRAYLADCMVMLKQVPDKYYDLSVVDPQYGIQEDGRNNHTRSVKTKAKDYRSASRYDDRPPGPEYFAELFRVSKHQIIWGANHFGNLAPASCWIVWDKENGENDFADCELAWTSPRLLRCSGKEVSTIQVSNKVIRMKKLNKPPTIPKTIHFSEKEKDDVLKRFMKEFFPFGPLRKAGFFTKEMRGDYKAQAERVCHWFGFKTVYEYGVSAKHITNDGGFTYKMESIYE